MRGLAAALPSAVIQSLGLDRQLLNPETARRLCTRFVAQLGKATSLGTRVLAAWQPLSHAQAKTTLGMT